MRHGRGPTVHPKEGDFLALEGWAEGSSVAPYPGLLVDPLRGPPTSQLVLEGSKIRFA